MSPDRPVAQQIQARAHKGWASAQMVGGQCTKARDFMEGRAANPEASLLGCAYGSTALVVLARALDSISWRSVSASSYWPTLFNISTWYQMFFAGRSASPER